MSPAWHAACTTHAQVATSENTMRLLTVVDLCASPVRTLRTAVDWALRLGGDNHLDIAHVDVRTEHSDYIHDPELREMVLHDWDDVKVSYGAQLDMLRLKLPKTLRGQTRLLYGHPARAILDALDPYDALLLGRFGPADNPSSLLGCTLHHLARNAPIPVVVLHEPVLPRPQDTQHQALASA